MNAADHQDSHYEAVSARGSPTRSRHRALSQGATARQVAVYDEALTRPQKKELEQHIARAFIEAARLGAEPVHGDRPDVHLQFDGGDRIGLEITELTDPDLKASSAAMKRLGIEARKLLGNARVFVHIRWRVEAWLNPKDTKRAANQLVALVREIMRHRKVKRFGRRRMLKRYEALQQVEDVLLFPDEDGPKVSATSETWSARRLPEVVQARLNEKETKLASYRAAIGAPQWIVIATGSERSQHVMPQVLPANHVYASSFDRAFLLDVPIRQLWELNLSRASAGPTPS